MGLPDNTTTPTGLYYTWPDWGSQNLQAGHVLRWALACWRKSKPHGIPPQFNLQITWCQWFFEDKWYSLFSIWYNDRMVGADGTRLICSDGPICLVLLREKFMNFPQNSIIFPAKQKNPNFDTCVNLDACNKVNGHLYNVDARQFWREQLFTFILPQFREFAAGEFSHPSLLIC